MLEHFFEDLPEDLGKLIIEMLEAVLDEYRQWLVDRLHMPFSTMIWWMVYGKAVYSNEGGMAKVIWAGRQCLQFLGQLIELTWFRQVAAASIDKSERLLDGLIFSR